MFRITSAGSLDHSGIAVDVLVQARRASAGHSFRSGLLATRFRAGVADEVALTVEAGNEHWPAVVVAALLP